MVRMLVIGSKVCRFKSSQGDGILREIKIYITPSFLGEVRPEASFKTFWYVKKITYK
jgi:hypothetical protein